MICSGVATCFGKMKLAARNGNYKLKKKSQLFIEFPGTWFDNLKVVERIKSECLLKIFILLPVELCVGVGRTTPPPQTPTARVTPMKIRELSCTVYSFLL